MKKHIVFLPIAAAFLGACANNDVDYDASGVFEATEVIVSAKQAGELTAFNAVEGAKVSVGDTLGQIDAVQLKLKRQQLTASMTATDSRRLDERRQVAAIRQQIANLERERSRFAELVREKAANQKQLDDIDYQLKVLQRQLAAQSEQIGSNNSSLTGQTSSIAAQVAQIDDQIANSTITSPISGTIMAKYTERGEYAVPGKALFMVADMRHLKLRAYVTAAQLTTLRVGQTATVYADQGESGRKAYSGVVEWVSDKAEFTPKTIQTRDERANLVYAVKVAVTNDGMIKAGMYGDVKF